MSLFICAHCGTIENTACVDRNIDTNPLYPNLCRQEMQGYGVDDVVINQPLAQYQPGDIKKGTDVLMLCSACNTGQFHNEFDIRHASANELELAIHSKYNMITPYDHPDNTITRDDDAPHGYRTFEISDAPTPYQQGSIGTKKEASALLAMGAALASFGIDPFSAYQNRRADLPLGLGNVYFSKDEQSELDRNRMLELAELKRQIKKLKKENGDKSVLFDLVQKYKEMK